MFYDGDDTGDGALNRSRMKGMRGMVTDASGSTTWTYDARYRLLSEEKTIGSRRAVTTFGYTSYQLNSISTPGGSAAYTFTAGAEPKTLTAGQPIVTEAEYNAHGNLTRLSVDAQHTRRTEYDYYGKTNNFRLQGITVHGGASAQILMQREYEYDLIGNITAIDDKLDNRYDQTFKYDALSRLTDQTNASFLGGREHFTYSAAGNLLHKNGRDYTYWPGTHQVRREGQHRYAYDASGNLRTKETLDENDEVIHTLTYHYDVDNRLVSLSSGERYEYDFSGRRVKKTEQGGTTFYFNQYYEEQEGPSAYILWTSSGSASPIAPPVTPVNSPSGTTYFYFNGLRVAQEQHGEFTWIHSDHLHSATVLSDNEGNEVRRLAYASFGEEVENIGIGNAPRYTYTGKERDVTGLMYYGARYYDPALSRFITPDTIYDWGPQGLNRYSYSLNNPLRYVDPLGYAAKEWENWKDELQQNITNRYDKIHPYDRTQEVKDRIAFEETRKLQNKYRLLYYQTRDYDPALEAMDALYQHDLSNHEIKNGTVRAFVQGFLIGFGLGVQISVQEALSDNVASADSSERVLEVNPKELRWSQTTAGGRGRADAIRQSMSEKGWAGEPIDVVKTPDGLVTVDHTRAAVALELGIEKVPVRVHMPNESLPADMRSRPWNRFGQTAETWGEAVKLRGAGQTPSLGPTGTSTPPRLPHPKRR